MGGHAAAARPRLVGAGAVQEQAVVERAVACLQQDGLFALAVDSCVGNFLVLPVADHPHLAVVNQPLAVTAPHDPQAAVFKGYIV